MNNARFANGPSMTIDKHMAAFDMLPPRARAVLRETVSNYCAATILQRLVRDHTPIDDQLAAIRQADKVERLHYHAISERNEARAARRAARFPLEGQPDNGQGRLL